MTEQQAPADDKSERIEKLLAILQRMSKGQLFWLEKVIHIFDVPGQYESAESDLITRDVLHDFGDALKIHHAFSVEPFSKDKFEYVLEQVLLSRGTDARLTGKGTPGADIIIRGKKYSLKTQADKGLKQNELWISKFMELGAGAWGSNPDDLIGLRQQFLNHITRYDRILSLRTLSKAPDWRYELVEIPKSVFERASQGTLEMKLKSKQNPKPGNCYVEDENGARMYELYFDGGTERKLQVKKLSKTFCKVHATWVFSIPKI